MIVEANPASFSGCETLDQPTGMPQLKHILHVQRLSLQEVVASPAVR